LLECVIVSQSGSSGVRLQIQGGAPLTVGETTIVNAIVTNTGNVSLNSVALESQAEASVMAVNVSPNATVAADGSDGKPVVLGIGRLEPGDSKLIEIEYEGISADGSSNLLYTVTSAEEVTASEELTLRVEPAAGSDNRGTDPNTPDFSPTPRVPNFNSGTGSGEPQINIPQDSQPLGQSGLDIRIESAKQPISAARGDEAPVRFRVTNNDTFVHENVNITLVLPDGLLFSNFDPENSPLRTVNQLFAAVPRVDFDTRRTLRPDETLEGVLFVTGKNVGQHPVEILSKSDQVNWANQTDFVNVSQ